MMSCWQGVLLTITLTLAIQVISSQDKRNESDDELTTLLQTISAGDKSTFDAMIYTISFIDRVQVFMDEAFYMCTEKLQNVISRKKKQVADLPPELAESPCVVRVANSTDRFYESQLEFYLQFLSTYTNDQEKVYRLGREFDEDVEIFISHSLDAVVSCNEDLNCILDVPDKMEEDSRILRNNALVIIQLVWNVLHAHQENTATFLRSFDDVVERATLSFQHEINLCSL